MTAMASRGDLNLNLTPAPEYEEHLKEGLKYAMVQHEIVFKHQVFLFTIFYGCIYTYNFSILSTIRFFCYLCFGFHWNPFLADC